MHALALGVAFTFVPAALAQTLDFAEQNAAEWGVFASDGASASTALDTTRVKEGESAIRFTTLSGFDTGVRFPASANLNLDASAFTHLVFWEYPENTTPVGWQGAQPVVVIRTGVGGPAPASITLTPDAQQTGNFAWKLHKVPLGGGHGWTRATSGTPDLHDVDQIEIHHDTWDFGFNITFDGVRFMALPNGGLPPAGPPAPFNVDPDAIEPRVLLYVFDPIVESQGGQRLHEVYGWQDPVLLARAAMKDLLDASHGRARFNVVEVVIADEYPRFADGFQHDDASFAIAWENRDFHEGVQFDYVGFAQAHQLPARVDAGEIDEVWLYAPPIGGMWESCMAGQGAYWINGPAYPGAGGQRVYAIMGLNCERGVAEAIHSFGHRAESTMVHVYGEWQPNRDTMWNRFTLRDSQAPGQGGVGNVHFPVNGASDYDYDSPASVQSNADAWYRYPNLHDATRAMNSTEWSPAHADPQREYLRWWYTHLPHAPGRGPDFYLANWWRYLLDLEQFKSGGARLEDTLGVPNVQIVQPADGAHLVGAAKVVVDASVDGALGRVDLYVDGVYRASDTLAPYTFDLPKNALAPGAHTLVAKAYELQTGTEAATPGRTIIVDACLADVTGIGGLPAPPDASLTVDDLIAFVNSYIEGCEAP